MSKIKTVRVVACPDDAANLISIQGAPSQSGLGIAHLMTGKIEREGV